MSRFSDSEAEILNLLQKAFPLTESPYGEIGEKLGVRENEVIAAVAGLKEQGVVRNISGIFDGTKLGYHLSLVAFMVPEERIEEAAAVINTHPGVSHNYLREHRYNIWFTLAEESPGDFDKTVAEIAALAGAEDTLVLRNEKLYKIGFTLTIGAGDDKNIIKEKSEGEVKGFRPLEDFSRQSIFTLQKDLPLVSRPFDALAEKAGLESGAQLLAEAEELKEAGYMRRYAAVLRHRKAGYTSNAMTAWRVPENVSDETVRPFGEEKAVTHLYLRTLYPGKWEHRLFAMVHAKSDDELNGLLNRLGDASGLKDRLVLRSLKEFKKQKVIYFSPAFTDWKEKYYD